MRQQRTMIPLVLAVCALLAGTLQGAIETEAARLYKWRGADGSLVFTDEPPPEGVPLLEIIEADSFAGAPAGAAEKPVETAASEIKAFDRCRLLSDARRVAEQTAAMAILRREKADEAGRRVDEMRERIGYDDEQREDLADNLQRLEEKERLAEAAARLAEQLVLHARLQVRLAEVLAPDCPGQ